MGRIVRRKTKGRPSNADPPRRNFSGDRQPRRSGRCRNVRYNFDLDDYVVDEDEDFYDEVGSREKKIRVLLGEDDSESNQRAESSSSEDYEVDDEIKSSKKRKIDAGDGDGEYDGEDEEDNEIGEVNVGKMEEEDAEAAGGVDTFHGSHSRKGVLLPDKKALELILDKLQKKDIYGVYAEPVDPDELPDYYDVIKHPMDFATVRKKLAKGTYLTLEQFESDVLLISTNAMQYNAPDTVYHKQASLIQDLAKSKFQRLRLNLDHSTIELNSQHKIKPNSSPPKKQSKNSLVRTLQEEPMHDENRRATFGILIKPVFESESIFSTFEDESKQFIPVGLHADHSYTRSLARFAATLGSVAWKLASRRIEQALLENVKFGRGWVGEYEPLPTPVLILENSTFKESDFRQAKPSETATAKHLQRNSTSGKLIEPEKKDPPQVERTHKSFPEPQDQKGLVQMMRKLAKNEPNQQVYPQHVATDLSRFQVRSGWTGVRPKQQESRVAPDLNIGYKSSSSNVLIDSQHPDLALQL